MSDPCSGVEAVKQQFEPNITFTQHERSVLERHANNLNSHSPEMVAEMLHGYLSNEREENEKHINLIASESKVSPSVRALLADPIGGRMGGGQIGKSNRLFPGCDNIDDVESLCIEAFKKLFNASYCEHRLTTNMLAITLVYLGLIRAGDAVMSFSLPDGGDTSNTPLGPLGLIGAKTFTIPFDMGKQDIKWEEFEASAREIKPKIVSISKTVSLFSVDIGRIKNIIQEWGGILFVDAAHELGLIAGGVMENPLDLGADLMCGSVGKSFSGPQSGILLWNDPSYTALISKTAFPMLVSSYQLNRVAASALAALEMLEFGHRFMRVVVENANAFARKLYSNGIPVFFGDRGFTETHQVLVNVSQLGGGKKASKNLADVGILSNQIISPLDGEEKLFDPGALRFGFVGVSRLGMEIVQIEEIADIVSGVLKGELERDSGALKVSLMAKKYQKIYYNFENKLPA